MNDQFEWRATPNGTAWYYVDRNGFLWGGVMRMADTAYGVFVRDEFRASIKWLTRVDSLDEAKALLQTVVGVNNV